jgi:hypothetical protein
MGNTLGQVHPDMIKFLQALSKTAGAAGQGIAGRPPAQTALAPQQGSLPAMQPTPPPGFPSPQAPTVPMPQTPQQQAQGQQPISYDTGGTQGSLPKPVQRPPIPGYQSPAGGDILQSKLGPQGAAVYSGIQGVSEVLNKWNQRKEQKEAAEAANIANNLMQAIESKDVGMVSEILNDPKQTKVLNKVYKGWLQQTEEAKKASQTQKKPDSVIQGFEQGIASFFHKKQQQQQPQQPPQAPPQTQGQPGQMPQSVGGYRIPQAGPAQLQARAAQNANIQADQRDPQRMVTPTQYDWTPKTATEYEKYQAQIEKSKTDILASHDRVTEFQHKAEAANQNFKAAMVRYKTAKVKGAEAGEKGKLDLQKANLEVIKARAQADNEKIKLDIQLAKLRGITDPNAQMKLSAQNKLKLEALGTAADIVAGVQKREGGFTQADVASLSGLLRTAGASGLASTLSTNMVSRWWGGKEEVDAIAKGIADQQKTMQQAWNVGGGAPKTAAEGGEAPPKAGDIIDTPQGKMKFKGGDFNDQKNYVLVTPASKAVAPAAAKASDGDDNDGDDDGDDDGDKEDNE